MKDATEMGKSGDLHLQMSQKSNEELYAILFYEADYVPEALNAAKEEVAKRNLDSIYEENLQKAKSNKEKQLSNSDEIEIENVVAWKKKFNLGAFFLTPLWLMFHGKAGIGFLLIFVYSLSDAALLFSIYSKNPIWIILAVLYWLSEFVVIIYYGKQGNRITWADELNPTLVKVQKREGSWAMAGAIVTAIYLVLLFYRDWV